MEKVKTLKPLKPSMRENKRYLLVVGHMKDLKNSIVKAILEFSGTQGMSKAGLSFISTEEGKAIIAVNRQAVDNVRAAISIFKEKMTVKRVSGTLKGLKS